VVAARAKEVAIDIVRRLRAAGHVAVLAGGCVRDRLLGLEDPRGDYDVATSARPEEVQRLFPRTVAVGAQFGVVRVVQDGVEVEVATFRSDESYVDGRHPVSVRFTTAREDAERRDFTINGMFYDPISDRVLDYVGGREDLERGIVRAIGDPRRRFQEDRLRMIRAVRFAARLQFRLDPQTAAAIREMAPAIHEVSPERIGEELTKILLEGNARRGFELLSETGLAAEVLPEIEALRGVAQGREVHPEGDAYVHTMLALSHFDRSPRRVELASSDDPQSRRRLEALAFAVVLHDVGKARTARISEGRITFYGHCEVGEEMTREILRRLRRPTAVSERAAWLVRNHLRIVDAPKMRTATLKRFLRQEGIEDLLELARIDADASHGDLRNYEFCRVALARFSAQDLKPPPLLRGEDLIRLGYRPGPQFRQILSAVEEAQLEGEISTREEALALVAKRFPRVEAAR
jgi:poly(A) polymerase